MEWLPEFALTYSEIEAVSSANMVRLMREAAKKIYTTKKFKKRGEFGELFLHAAVRQVFGSLPAISKIYYKSAGNDTVKGFDVVHVVGPPDNMELWLGEAKFYKNIGRAIASVVAEIRAHTATNYLRDEFLLISGKIDPRWPHAKQLKKLLSPNTSLDVIFKRACIPVLLTYDSECLANHVRCDDHYKQAFESEILQYRDAFAAVGLPSNRTIHLFLLPLHTKKVLIAALDDRLKHWQG